MRDREEKIRLGAMELALRGLSAAQELQLERWRRENENTLAGWGLFGEDAAALAENAALVFAGVEPQRPFRDRREVLERFSLSEIARLTRCWQEWDEEDEE